MTNGRLLLAVLLAGLAGCLGAIAADRWLNHEDNGSLHQFVHEELVLTEDQNSRLETLEALIIRFEEPVINRQDTGEKKILKLYGEN